MHCSAWGVEDYILNKVHYSPAKEQNVRIVEGQRGIVVSFNDAFLEEVRTDVEAHEASLS